MKCLLLFSERGTGLRWSSSDFSSLLICRFSLFVSLSLSLSPSSSGDWKGRMIMAQKQVAALRSEAFWEWLRCIVIEAAKVLQSCSVAQLVLVLHTQLKHTWLKHPELKLCLKMKSLICSKWRQVNYCWSVRFTSVCTMAGLCVRSVFMVWNMSTTPSYLIRSRTILKVMKTPVLPTPALTERERAVQHTYTTSRGQMSGVNNICFK